MPLAFDDRGLLPPGVHEASWEVVEEQFARFQRTDRRLKLFGKLRDYAREVKRSGCGTGIVIDGSFVMPCVDEPEDIDVILVLPADWDLSADLKPYQYNLVSKRRSSRGTGSRSSRSGQGHPRRRSGSSFSAR